MKLFPYIILFFLLTGCIKETKPQAASHPAATTLPDDAAAEIAPGRFRPDTAKVYLDSIYKGDSSFLVISKCELRLNVYAVMKGDTVLVARYPVCLAQRKGQKQESGDMTTPESSPEVPFYITEIVDSHTWKHDFGDGRGEILSYGPWFMRLKTPFSGIGIHGSTSNAHKVPGRDSEGCIRLRDADLEHFKSHYARVGMPVIIKTETQGRLPYEVTAMKSPGHATTSQVPQ